jgi:predicted dehydrogenase
MALRRLHIDFEALAGAMGNQGRDEYDYYLDTTTGRVMSISTEVWNALEEGRTIAGSLAGWQQEELREAREVFGDTQGRYILIPERSTWEIEELMADFIDTVTDEELRKKLSSALDGRDALRRFRDILARYPEERQRWLALKQASDQEYATRWLADEEIEPVWISDSTPQRHA